MCWLEMRSVARSSIGPMSLMSGTLEQPTLVDQRTHIAQDALGVVVEFGLFLGLAQLGVAVTGMVSRPFSSSSRTLAYSGLSRSLLDVGGPAPGGQCRACRVAPVGLGTQAVLAPAFGWLIFCFIISAIGSGIRPCRSGPRRPQSRPTSTLALVALDPGAGLHVALCAAWGHQHAGVHFVAGAVQEAGVDGRPRGWRRRRYRPSRFTGYGALRP